MDAKKEKVLAALLSYPTKELAAKAAGVSSKTINRYLRDAEFAAAYRRAASELVDNATKQLQKSMETAVLRLRKIAASNSELSSNQIAASRALLDYGLRFTEFNDVLKELEAREGGDVL